MAIFEKKVFRVISYIFGFDIKTKIFKKTFWVENWGFTNIADMGCRTFLKMAHKRLLIIVGIAFNMEFG